MAIKLENKVNTDAPSTAYPFGNIKDNTGSNNGTPVDKNVYADFHQFFAKMMAESGIVYNDLPDNATTGFQYWLALVEAVKNNCGAYEDISVSISIHPNITATSIICHNYANGDILIRLNANINTSLNIADLILNLLPNGAGGQTITGYVWKSSAPTVKIAVPLSFNVSTISPISLINSSLYDRINIYFIYKKE